MRDSPFFDGVRQIDAEIADQPVKLPAFYCDAAELTTLFPARSREMRRLLPDRRFEPALRAVRPRASDAGDPVRPRAPDTGAPGAPGGDVGPQAVMH
jgi:hypothetical protein